MLVVGRAEVEHRCLRHVKPMAASISHSVSGSDSDERP
jgi:hypothetical protein